MFFRELKSRSLDVQMNMFNMIMEHTITYKWTGPVVACCVSSATVWAHRRAQSTAVTRSLCDGRTCFWTRTRNAQALESNKYYFQRFNLFPSFLPERSGSSPKKKFSSKTIMKLQLSAMKLTSEARLIAQTLLDLF